MGSDESHFNVSLIVRNKVTRQCPQTTTFEEKEEPTDRWAFSQSSPAPNTVYSKTNPGAKARAHAVFENDDASALGLCSLKSEFDQTRVNSMLFTPLVQVGGVVQLKARGQ